MVEPGEFNPASPPTLENIPELKTLPVAKDAMIDPEPKLKRPFWPTSPPRTLNPLPVTLPLADEAVMIPRLVPTSPPAMFKAPGELELPTLTFAAELESSIRPLFRATSPPAPTPVCGP